MRDAREAGVEVMAMRCIAMRLIGLSMVVLLASELWDGPMALAVGAVVKAVVGLVG